jgi:hypothetical protein
MRLAFLPNPPQPDPNWMRGFTLHLLRLAPTEAAEIWDETMSSRTVNWRDLH